MTSSRSWPFLRRSGATQPSAQRRARCHRAATCRASALARARRTSGTCRRTRRARGRGGTPAGAQSSVQTREQGCAQARRAEQRTMMGHQPNPGSAPMPPCWRPLPSHCIFALAMPHLGHEPPAAGAGAAAAGAAAGCAAARGVSSCGRGACVAGARRSHARGARRGLAGLARGGNAHSAASRHAPARRRSCGWRRQAKQRQRRHGAQEGAGMSAARAVAHSRSGRTHEAEPPGLQSRVSRACVPASAKRAARPRQDHSSAAYWVPSRAACAMARA
jgi:hypothetical protein